MSGKTRLLKLLLQGQRVGTDNQTCAQLGTNQVPDLARKLRVDGIEVQSESKNMIREGKKVRCSEYYLEHSTIRAIKEKQYREAPTKRESL